MFKQKAIGFFELAGFRWMVPVVKLACWENPGEQTRDLGNLIGLPVLAIALFLLAWSFGAAQVDTSLGELPGPTAVWHAGEDLYAEHKAEQERKAAFYERQEKRHARQLEKNPDAELRYRSYTGYPTFIDQIFTSLKTVFTGFALAALIAVPIGIACGLSKSLNAAVSPIIQLLKPVSPLAWLPIVTMIVSAVYVSDDPLFAKSFINSAITVTLCCMWPALINTAVGVGSIDRDLINVGRVIQLGWFTSVRKIALPAALPMIFTGLRISLGIGWMVLIAAEMLAQNPGLGKFVWDEFQNGSSQSLARIMAAVITIGFIGFVLDWLMLTLQKMVSHEEARS